MHEPRINLLLGDSGKTFAHAGFIVFRESSTYFEHVLHSHPTDQRAYEAALAYNHEIIHFVSSITTGFLYRHSLELITSGFHILKNFNLFLETKNKTTEFSIISEEISERKSGISARDLLEGIAVTESHKLISPDPESVETFIYRLDEFCGNNSESTYRKTFDYLSEKIGNYYAYNLLSPISYIALQTANPPEFFKNVVENLLPQLPLDLLIISDISVLFMYFGLDIKESMIFHLDDFEDDMKHPVLYDLARHAVTCFGPEQLSEIAARPSLTRSLNLNIDLPSDREKFESIIPPIIQFSAAGGAKATFRYFGIARDNPKLRNSIIYLASLIGAVERLTIHKDKTDLYQFCPHNNNCEHYESALCFSYFAPPSFELGYEKCGFPRFFEAQTKTSPRMAWSRFKLP